MKLPGKLRTDQLRWRVDENQLPFKSTTEVDPARGKISSNSPIGKAIIGRAQGETADITAPLGKLRYQIKLIERK